jgi:hypothetical protein
MLRTCVHPKLTTNSLNEYGYDNSPRSTNDLKSAHNSHNNNNYRFYFVRALIFIENTHVHLRRLAELKGHRHATFQLHFQHLDYQH